MNELMIEMLVEELDREFKEDLEEELVFRPQVLYLEIMTTLIAHHRRITPPILEKNQDKMKNPWDPTTPIKSMFIHIKKTAKFSC